MKQYNLKLKGTKKNNTSDLNIIIYGDNKSQAFSWAWLFFKKGEFRDPYYAEGSQCQCGGTVEFIPTAESLMDLRGKYFVPASSVTIIR